MTPRAMRLAFLVILTSLAWSTHVYAGQPQAELRVLVLSGQNNHDWRTTTPQIKAILEESGRFTVDVTEHPEQVTAEVLAKYDVVVSNWNSFHRGDPPPVVDWPEPTRQAFVDFVRGGKGFVTVHAGGSSFYDDWPAYHELVIARYGFGQTGHGVRHAFPVRIDDGDHPITRGMRGFMMHDELWHKPAVAPGATVLASAFSAIDTSGSGDFEPVVFVRSFGTGRCFTTLLGHDVHSMRQPIFGAILSRGTEWAATGRVTLPLPTNWPATPAAVAALDAPPAEALEAIRSYRFGQDRTPLQIVEALVAAAADPQQCRTLANRMAGMLLGETSVDCKRFLCRQLAQIGSAEHVPALAPLLRDPQLTVPARGALEAMPAAQASAALREALRSTDGAIRIGLVQSLARRRDGRALPLILQLAKTGDRDTQEAALAALGEIGGLTGQQALLAVKPQLSDDLKSVWADAVLLCADRLLRAGDHQAARPLYEVVVADSQTDHVRIAALAGYLVCEEKAGSDRLWTALEDDDERMQTAALRALREYGSARQLAGLAARLAQLPDRLQAEAIALLAAEGVASALPGIVKAAEHANPDVRQEALSALGILGDESTIPVLLARLDGASRGEKGIIADSLARLRGAEVNARMIALAKTAAPNHARALIKALVARKASGAVPGLLELARRDDSELADEAVAALGALGDIQVYDDLVNLLRSRRRAASADVIRQALVQLSRQLPEEQAQPALAALATADDRLAAELMPVLSTLGGPSAMQAVRDRTSAPDEDLRLAAVRALSSWQNPSVLKPLIEVAGAAALARERILALRGFARLLQKAESLPQEERSALLQEAIRLAGRPDEKRALLSCASAAPSAEVFQWVAECLKESELAGEAALAALGLARPLYRTHPELVSRVLRRILTVSPNEEIHSRAFQSLCQLGLLANLALKAKADSPDDLAPDHDGQEAHAAIDGNPETYWDEQDSQSEYRLRLKFEQPTAVAAISILGWAHHNHAPRGFAVVCDDRTVTTIRSAAYVDNFLLVAIPATTCTTLELVISDYYGQSPAIRELGVYGPLPDVDASQLEWQQTDSTLTLLNHGRPVWMFHYGPEDAKPFFHPLTLADGTALTCEGPQDHPWHHGLWFSWKYINGVNYWEEDRETRRSEGRTTVDDVKIETTDTYAARLQLALRYGPPDGKPVLTEQRVIEVSPPDETGRYHLDWTLSFTAGESNDLLDRTPLPEEPDGRAWGGYAGLSVRFAQELAERQAVSSKGIVELKDGRHRSKATAMDYSGIIDGQPAGIAILDHPRNLNAPSPWYVIQTDVMSYFSPAVLCYGPHTLPTGESFTLRYRVIVHPGRWDAARLQNEYEEFARSSSE